MRPNRVGASLIGAIVLTSLMWVSTVAAATVPSGFPDPVVVSGLSNPTSMAFAPDGRLFVTQQGGALRVIKNGALLATPFLTVTGSSSWRRGPRGGGRSPGPAAH